MTKSAFGIDHVSKAFAGTPKAPGTPKLQAMKPSPTAQPLKTMQNKLKGGTLSPVGGAKKPMTPGGAKPAAPAAGASTPRTGASYPVQPPRRMF